MSVKAYVFDGTRRLRLKDEPTGAGALKQQKEELKACTAQNLQEAAELQEKLFVKLEVPDFGNTVEKINRTDGCKVYFTDGSWVICRFSGTEPLLRMAAEGESQSQAKTYIRIWREELGL